MKNGKFYKTGLLLAVCLGMFIYGSAQEFIVQGKLVDSVSSKPLADATVNFLNPGKKTSETVISDKSGAFRASLSSGGYKVTITHGSFRKKIMHLAVQEQQVDMGSIQVVALVKSLAEVTVTAARPLVEQKEDRLIYNVEEDPAAKSESASDILRKTPYVNVDGDGAIQVNGQSNFKVLLDGRETALFSQNVKEALKAFPGATISRIEVITSPSAKYDAEGVGGIINIITKKKVAGYNGSINSNITSTGNKSAGLNISVKKGKLGITGTYSLMSNDGLRTNQLAVTTPGQPLAFVRREVGGGRETDMFFHQGSLELSYDLDSTNTLVVYGNMTRIKNEALSQHSIYTLFANGSSDTDPFLLENRLSLPTHGFGTDFIRKYKGKPQKELTFRFQGLFNKNRSYANSQQELGAFDRFILNNSEAFNNEYTVQADLIEPLKKGARIETGVKTILRRAYSDFESQVKFNKSDPYHIDPANSNRFSYDQNVYGGYVSLSKITKAITARIGLRVEHTDVEGDFTSTATVVRQQYTSFIPNLMLSKQFSKSNNTNLTYTMRLGRPSITSLNPFVNNSDSLFISYGNPDLGPQYIHIVSLQTRFFKGSKFISIQGGFNFSNNLIIQNPSFDPATGVTSVTGANAGQIREFTLGFVSNLPVGKKWNIAVNATARLARMRNSLQSSWSSYAAGNVNANLMYKASPRFTITSNGGYFLPLRTPNNTFPDNYFYGFNFAYKVFKQKMTITASATNFLEEKRKLVFLTENDFFVTENMNTVLFRNFGLALSYNFGRLKENVSKKKGVNNDDQVQ
ncbi:MAG TPA: outer membrane beta-barrel protein [Chitinophagaceae bacterium]|jgi:outer membrane receptor protein involved in Fe transport|nr:outer membrane beta-barrel protein [Chitinophagaceae bacterium]